MARRKNTLPYDGLMGNTNATLPKGKRKRKRIAVMITLSGERLSLFEAMTNNRTTDEIVEMARKEIYAEIDRRAKNVFDQMENLN